MSHATAIDSFRTTDFYFASTLLALATPLDEVEWRGKRATFLFTLSRQEAHDLSKQYANGTLKVSPRDLFAAISELRRFLDDHRHD
ncbi:MAG: hypothetical protein GXP25_15900 [Planctomycetes bacterium]|nr:hypothetical protein [Planctomycetota bacterium]